MPLRSVLFRLLVRAGRVDPRTAWRRAKALEEFIATGQPGPAPKAQTRGEAREARPAHLRDERQQ